MCLGSRSLWDLLALDSYGENLSKGQVHVCLFHAVRGICLSGWRAGSDMYTVYRVDFDKASSVPQLIWPMINLSLLYIWSLILTW